MTPLVSIIIPLYNAENYISEAIKSGLNQSYKNIEIIIIDDGSIDGSFLIAKKFENHNVKVFHQANKGASAARNFGFKYSKGKYIQYLDADDVLSPTKIENQLLMLENLPEGYIASCGWISFRNSTSDGKFCFQEAMQDCEPTKWLTIVWNGGGMMLPSCWLTPKNLIVEAGLWDESLSLNDDGEFFCRVVLKSSGIRYSNLSLVYYRDHDGERISRSKSKKSIRSLLESYISYEQNILLYDNSLSIRNALAKNYASFIYGYNNMAPELSKIAEQRIYKLGIKKIPIVGGKYFQIFSKVLGFKALLKVRFFLKRY